MKCNFLVFFVYFEKWNFSALPKIFPWKKFLIFFPKENHSRKLSHIFSKKVFPIFCEVELSSPKLKKTSCIFGGNFMNSKNKKKKHSEKIYCIFSEKVFLIFLGIELSSLKKT